MDFEQILKSVCAFVVSGDTISTMKKIPVTILLILITGSGCLRAYAELDPFHTEPLTTPSPQTYWVKPPDLNVPDIAAQNAGLRLPHKALSLIELTDFALANSPNTRLAWYQAKAAAANVGIEQSAYLPTINGGFGVQYTANVFNKPNSSATTYGPNFSLSYLLLDFGYRGNQVLAAQYAQIATNLNQNNAIQEVILAVQQAYYQVLAQQALVHAYEENVKQAKASLDVAEALRQNGLATIGDVYQAQASYAQASLSLETAKGNYQTGLGQLASAMGLPVNTLVQIKPLQQPPKSKALEQSVEHILKIAQANRPDLLAAEAKVRQNAADLAATKASILPNLSLEASAKPGGVISNTTGTSVVANLTLSVPIFTGFSYTYQVRQAQAQVKAAEAARDQLNQQVQFQVWQNYFALQTAAKNITTTETLFVSSQQAYEQALGQYKNGVGDILTVLTTQATLANARVQHIQAQLNWYTALAQLAESAGVLTPGPGVSL